MYIQKFISVYVGIIVSWKEETNQKADDTVNGGIWKF